MRRRGRKTLSLLMKKQHWFWPVKYLMFSFSAYSSLLCKPPPLKTLITAVCTLQRDRKTSQLGDLPPGAIFSNRSQERSWKSWEALGDTCGHISVPFLNVLEVLRRPRQTNSKAVPCILQVTEGFFPRHIDADGGPAPRELSLPGPASIPKAFVASRGGPCLILQLGSHHLLG